MLMSRGIVGPRATYVYLGFWIGFAVFAGLVFGGLAT
jgi:hypothetical protein